MIAISHKNCPTEEGTSCQVLVCHKNCGIRPYSAFYVKNTPKGFNIRRCFSYPVALTAITIKGEKVISGH